MLLIRNGKHFPANEIRISEESLESIVDNAQIKRFYFYAADELNKIRITM